MEKIKLITDDEIHNKILFQNKKAEKLHHAVLKYQVFLLLELDKDSKTAKAIQENLNINNNQNAEKQKLIWIKSNFLHLPLLPVIDNLTILKNKILMCEYELLKNS